MPAKGVPSAAATTVPESDPPEAAAAGTAHSRPRPSTNAAAPRRARTGRRDDFHCMAHMVDRWSGLLHSAYVLVLAGATGTTAPSGVDEVGYPGPRPVGGDRP